MATPVPHPAACFPYIVFDHGQMRELLIITQDALHAEWIEEMLFVWGDPDGWEGRIDDLPDYQAVDLGRVTLAKDVSHLGEDWGQLTLDLYAPDPAFFSEADRRAQLFQVLFPLSRAGWKEAWRLARLMLRDSEIIESVKLHHTPIDSPEGPMVWVDWEEVADLLLEEARQPDPALVEVDWLAGPASALIEAVELPDDAIETLDGEDLSESDDGMIELLVMAPSYAGRCASQISVEVRP